VVSLEDAVKFLYKDGQVLVLKWFKAYSDKIANYRSHVDNSSSMLHNILKKYI